jgi:hypothetical protein
METEPAPRARILLLGLISPVAVVGGVFCASTALSKHDGVFTALALVCLAVGLACRKHATRLIDSMRR